MKFKNPKIAIIGLGYVGLPLAIEFSKNFKVIGYDINDDRINELLDLKDSTNEAEIGNLKEVLSPNKANKNIGLSLTSSVSQISSCTVFVITVPTPIDRFKAPNLGPLLMASSEVGEVLKKGDIVIYESTVYPGCTEQDCVPVLEKKSICDA